MKVNILVFLFPLITGCSYMSNRGNDIRDICTISAGHGLGGVVQVGPAHTGIGIISDNYGIRDGNIIRHSGFFSDATHSSTAELLIIGGDHCRSNIENNSGADRNTAYTTSNFMFVFPIAEMNKAKWSYYTKIDIGLAIGGSVRCGFNVGELLDFILGIITIDISCDDVIECAQQGDAPEPASPAR